MAMLAPRALRGAHLALLAVGAYLAPPVLCYVLLVVTGRVRGTPSATPFLWIGRGALVTAWLAALGASVLLVAAVGSGAGRVGVGLLLAAVLAVLAALVAFGWIAIDFGLFWQF